jgi:hypothetical protein
MRSLTNVAVLAGTLLAVAGPGCASSPTEPSGRSVPLGQPFRLAVGESVSVRGASFALGFEQVLDDSRCPADALCVWAGDARLSAWARLDGQPRREIELHTLQPNPLALERFRVEVRALEPFPYSNVRIDPRGYVVTLLITRQ